MRGWLRYNYARVTKVMAGLKWLPSVVWENIQRHTKVCHLDLLGMWGQGQLLLPQWKNEARKSAKILTYSPHHCATDRNDLHPSTAGSLVPSLKRREHTLKISQKSQTWHRPNKQKARKFQRWCWAEEETAYITKYIFLKWINILKFLGKGNMCRAGRLEESCA